MNERDCQALVQRYFGKKYAAVMSDEASQYLTRLDPAEPESVYKFLRVVGEHPQKRELLHEMFMGSILSGPATHGRNTIGNSMFHLFNELAVRPVRAAIDAPLAKLARRDRMYYMSEVLPAYHGVRRGFSLGAARAAKILRQGTPFRIGEQGKMQVQAAFARHPNATVRKTGAVLTFPLRALAAEDAFFKAIAYSMEEQAYAVRMAVGEGRRGDALARRASEIIANPDEKMLKALKAHEDFSTFNDPMSMASRRFLGLRDEVKGSEFLVPFVKIADRLFVRGMELTPVGFVRAARAAKRGDHAAVSDLTARASLGTMLMGGLAAYAHDGKIVGWAPQDRLQRELFYEEGKQEWSLKLGDKWVPFRQVEPLAFPMAAVAAWHSAWRDQGKTPEPQTIAAMGAGLGRFMLDKSFLTTLSDLVSGLERPNDPDAAARALYRTAAGLVPYSGAMRSIAVSLDPGLKRPDGLIETIKAGLPGLSGEIPSEVDRFGRDIEPAGGRARGVVPTGALLPATESRRTRVAQELLNLGVTYGRTTRSVQHNGETTRLSRRQSIDYQRAVGQEVEAEIERLLDRPEYHSWSDAARKKVIERAIRRARERAKVNYLNQLKGAA